MRLTDYKRSGIGFKIPFERVNNDGLSIWQLNRPRQLLEINKGKITPYSKRICKTCLKPLWSHWQRPVRSQDVTRWFCRRDGVSYAGAHFVRV